MENDVAKIDVVCAHRFLTNREHSWALYLWYHSKNKMESKLGNPTQTFREKMNLVLQLIEELQIKSKTVMKVGTCEREKRVFLEHLFCMREFSYYLCFFSIYSILNKLHDLLPHCSHSNTWQQEYMTLCPHSLN